MNRVSEIQGNFIVVTTDPGVLHPGRLYLVEKEAHLADGDVISVETLEVGNVLAIDVVIEGRIKRYVFFGEAPLKVTGQMLELLGFAEVADDPTQTSEASK